MRKLRIGVSNGKAVNLPIEFVTETAAILARRGAGKTYTGNVVAEEFLACGHQIVVIDPLNAWWGLRSSADGKKPGYPIVIFGGARGDLPLEVGMAKGVADLVAEDRDFSCVLSLRHMKKAEQKRFVAEFAEQLFHRKGEEDLATPVHVFIDEAHRFAPQFVRADDARVVGAIGDLVLGGRQAGIGVTLITQRSAKLNKDVLTQAELLVVGQITGPQDKKAVRQWIEENADDVEQGKFMASLAQLKRGQFWFWSPARMSIFARVDVRKKRTFDSSATPKAGRRPVAPKKVYAVDLKKIRSTLEVALKTAEQTDPKALRRRVAELEGQLRSKKPVVVQEAPKVEGIPEVEVKRLITEALTARDGEWKAAVEQMIGNAQTQLVVPTLNGAAVTLPKRPARTASSKKVVAPLGGSVLGQVAEIPLGRCERAILGVLAARGRTVTARLVALQSGYSIKSSGFKNALSSLRTKGLISGGKHELMMTGEGQVAHGMAGGDFRRMGASYWSGKLPKCERAIFDCLLQESQHALGREDIAAATGYSLTSSGFKNALSKLRGLELIEGRDEIRLVEELFEE